jgi:hypothetical protein
MIFDNLRDRVTVTIDTKSRKASVCEVPSSQRSASSTERPKRRRKATPKKATTKRRYAVRPTPQTERRKVEAPKRAERRSVTKRVATPSPRTYSPTVGGLFYATGRDGATSGYPRLSGLSDRAGKGGGKKSGSGVMYLVRKKRQNGQWYNGQQINDPSAKTYKSIEQTKYTALTWALGEWATGTGATIREAVQRARYNAHTLHVIGHWPDGEYYNFRSPYNKWIMRGWGGSSEEKLLNQLIQEKTVYLPNLKPDGAYISLAEPILKANSMGEYQNEIVQIKCASYREAQEAIDSLVKDLGYNREDLKIVTASVEAKHGLADRASKGGHTYFYWIDMDERGEFSAHVDNPHGKTVFEIPDAEAMEDLIQDGFMRHTSDIDDLAEYLKDRGIMGKNDTLVESNWYMNEEDEEEDDEDGETLDDSLASTLADYTVDDVRAVQDLNNKLRELDSSFQHVAFRVYTTGSKKSKYVLRRYELDLTSAQPVNHNRKEALRWKRSLQHKEVFYRTFLGAQMKEVGLFKPTSMSPKIADKYLRKHFGISWNDLLEEKTSTLKAKIAEYVARFRRDNEAKMEAMSRKQAEREERISTTKAARETAKAEREERIAKRRIEAEQRKEARRKPTPTAAPVMPSAMPEEVAAPAPRKTRKPRLPKAAATATTKLAPMPSAMPAQAAAVPSDGDLDKVEKDMAELKALLQQMITQK